MRSFQSTLLALFVATIGISAFALYKGWTTWEEALGFVTGALCVWLTAKENIWNWPIGLVNTVAYGYVFFKERIFADAGLQVVYFVLGILGWYWWLKGGEKHTKLLISLTPKREWIPVLVISVLATTGMTLYLFRQLDAAPYLDALTTVLSLVAQYLLTRKYIENWVVWIVVDLVYVPMYAWKGLYLTAILYIIFTVMAVGGLREWAKTHSEQGDREHRVPLWKPVQVCLGLGLIAWVWMGYMCGKFEAGLYGVINTLRASTEATLTVAPSREAMPPFYVMELDDPTFASVKAELLDPLYTRPHARDEGPSGLVSGGTLVFRAEGLPDAEVSLGRDSTAWVNTKPIAIFDASHIINRLPPKVKPNFEAKR